MKSSQEIQELEKQIAMDKQKYAEIERLETELMKHIPPQGFSAASTESKYRGEKEALADSIRRGEEMLAGLRSHPD
jgi:hypothetical protein